MLVYSVVMFLTAVLLMLLSMMIYRGKTNLIHAYHQTKVTDAAAYGKAFGKALSVVAMAPLLSGLVGLLGNAEVMAVLVLLAGIGIGTGCVVAVQKQYNKGVF
ncbi:MAG: hypothetical protein ACI4MJ_01550 [Aristaeellaceae bacterium]